MTYYAIHNWDRHFETSETRKLKGPLKWVPVPTKHDGKGFRRIMRRENGFNIYAAWLLILQVAAKCPRHGLLIDEDGPLSADDLADSTGAPPEIFELALSVLCEPKIGWMKEVTQNDGENPLASADETANSSLQDRTGQDITKCPDPDPGEEDQRPDQRPGDRLGGDSRPVSPRGPQHRVSGDATTQDDSEHVQKKKRVSGPPERRGARPSVFKDVTEDVLCSEKLLRSWFDWQAKQDARGSSPPVLSPDEWGFCQQAANQALAKGQTPVAMFIHLIKQRNRK